MRILVKKGLDIPISAKPILPLQNVNAPDHTPDLVSLSLTSFDTLRFKLLVKKGDRVKIGTPLLENKEIPNQFFVSPGSGTVVDFLRGEKRTLQNIVIQNEEEEYEEHGGIDINTISKEELLTFFLKTGLFPHIRMRPFNMIANPKRLPKAIFVKAIESLPYTPSAELQLSGKEEYFDKGLESLKKIANTIYLVHHENTPESCFLNNKWATSVGAKGPHPIGNSSIHIHHISPIKSPDECVWTLGLIDVITIGKMVLEGRYLVDRIIGLGGEGAIEEKRRFYHGKMGMSLKHFLKSATIEKPLTYISGDPLTGSEVGMDGFLEFSHSAISVIPKNFERESLHFLRLGKNKYSSFRAYLSSQVKPPEEGFYFTTNQHGEERPFIDGSIYDKVLPMKIPVMHLVKAILANDFELAEKLGLLEVAPEDFALPSFICPSKIDMVDIVKTGLKVYAREMGL